MAGQQIEILTETELLDAKGDIARPGWARRSLYRYDRKQIRASALRIKEWDYYCVLSPQYGIALTVADNGYMGFLAATVFNFTENTETSGSIMTLLPLGRFHMPPSSAAGDVLVDRKDIRAAIKVEGIRRYLSLDYPAFADGAGLSAELQLTPAVISDDQYDRMVIATPFDRRGRFYFNEKHNCLKAAGVMRSADFQYEFGKTEDAWGVLDWGRGVWTYQNTWFWGSASGAVDGIPFGFNIGYGFGNTSAATENLLFYNGRAHKLDAIAFNIPQDAQGRDRFLEPWTFTSSDGRFEMNFDPVLDRFDDTNVLLIRSNQHQVFGRFSGKAVLDDGTVIELDGFPGFAEKVYNRW